MWPKSLLARNRKVRAEVEPTEKTRLWGSPGLTVQHFSLIVRSALLFAAVALTCAGCWDRAEIDERAFVVGIGLDKPEIKMPETGDSSQSPGPSAVDPNITWEETGSEFGPSESIVPRYRVTAEIGIVKEMGGGGVSGGGGGGGGGGGSSTPQKEKPAWVISQVGATVGEALRSLSTRLDRQLFLGHNKVVVIGDSVAREGLIDAMDYFRRNEAPVRSMEVVVTPGDAATVLQVTPRISDLAGLYIRDELLDTTRTGRTVSVDFGKLLSLLHGRGGFMLPRVIPGKDDIVVSGVAAFREDKLVGWLNAFETQGAIWLTGETKVREIALSCRPIDGAMPVVQITAGSTRVRVLDLGNYPLFLVEIRVRGNLIEYSGNLDTTTPKFEKELEACVKETIKKQIIAVLDRAQKDFRTDVFGYGKFVERYQPALWEKVKENWNEVFSDSSVEISRIDFVYREPGGVTKRGSRQ